MHILKTSFSGSPNVGLFGFATDSYVLLGEHLDNKNLAKLKEALGDIPVHHVKIAGTSMPGVFLVGNSKAVLAPAIIFNHELEQLRKLDIPIKTVETIHTCLGNMIVCNDHGAIVSPSISNGEQKNLSDILGVPVVSCTVAGFDTPGAFIVLNGEKGIVHRDIKQEEKALIEKTLKVTLEPATANLGTPYVKAAIMNNSHGFIIGDQSGGPEIVHIDQTLGY